MNNKIIDGKEIAARKKELLKERISSFRRKPKLAVIQAGDDGPSQLYVKKKIQACDEVGIGHTEYYFGDGMDTDDVISMIEELNHNKDIDGILVQLPLPECMNERKVLDSIALQKDIDGLCSKSIAGLRTDDFHYLPCTVLGVADALCEMEAREEGYADVTIDDALKGKHVVIVGKSLLVGNPLAEYLLRHGATVTICHSRTKNLHSYTSVGDIVISCIGKALLLNGDAIKEGAWVVDVGISKKNDGKIVGDVDLKDCIDKCSYITPVPGGIGPLTVENVLENVCEAYLVNSSR